MAVEGEQDPLALASHQLGTIKDELTDAGTNAEALATACAAEENDLGEGNDWANLFRSGSAAAEHVRDTCGKLVAEIEGCLDSVRAIPNGNVPEAAERAHAVVATVGKVVARVELARETLGGFVASLKESRLSLHGPFKFDDVGGFGAPVVAAPLVRNLANVQDAGGDLTRALRPLAKTADSLRGRG